MPIQNSAVPVPFFQLLKGAKFIAREPKIVPATPNAPPRYTEYYCQSNGSNLNGGSTTDAAALYTTTNGNWSTVTNQFIPTDGSSPFPTVKVGEYVAIYPDGSTNTPFIGMVTNVAQGVNGPITVDPTKRAGSAPTTSATGRSLKFGGAWKGPNGANAWPFAVDLSLARNKNDDPVRVNLKNDATYSISANLNGGTPLYQGYSLVPGDGGKATIDGGNNAIILLISNQACVYADLVFSNNGSSGTNQLVNGSGLFFRCVFHDARGGGLTSSGNIATIECEFYNCNTSNTAGIAALQSSGGGTFIAYRCYLHDLSGVVPGLIVSFNVSLNACIVECIFDGITGNATEFPSSAGSAILFCNNSFYNIGGYAIKDTNFSSASYRPYFLYNNLIVNCGGIIHGGAGAIPSIPHGFLFGNAFFGIRGQKFTNCKGFQGPGEIALSAVPFNAPTTGDFSLVLAEAIGVGRGVFTQTAAGKSGSVAYPDLGALQVPSLGGGLGSSETTLKDGYLNHAYYVLCEYEQSFTLSVTGGSLPPGLLLSQPSSTSFLISGTSTAVGAYSATITMISPTGGTGTFTINITVYDDPDEGVGGTGGG